MDEESKENPDITTPEIDKGLWEQRTKVLNSTLGEIYEKYDKARDGGIDISTEGKNSPLREGETVPEQNATHLFYRMENVENQLRDIKGTNPKTNEEGVPYLEFNEEDLSIKAPVEGNAESKEFIKGNLLMSFKHEGKNINIKWEKSDEDYNFYSLTIDYPDEEGAYDKYEGLRYKSDNLKDENILKEDYAVMSYFTDKAFKELVNS